MISCQSPATPTGDGSGAAQFGYEPLYPAGHVGPGVGVGVGVGDGAGVGAGVVGLGLPPVSGGGL
ncbi:TPA: hypothetical protein DEW05_02735 [Candidatus Saccharibacteria bacterium]|nr:hypothetical protein [Candidatus Saccharibacteria bacterium]